MAGGWQGSSRKARLPGNWEEIVAVVMRRDGRSCQHIRYDTGRMCGLPAQAVDHIINNDDHSLSNLRAICSWHHDKKSSREGNRARGRRRLSAQERARRELRPSELHPGIIV